MVALSVERLLGRLDQLPEFGGFTQETIFVLIQSTTVIGIPSLYWWITARWSVAIRWRFGFFDAVYPMIFLVLIHLMVTSIGASTTRWFAALGLASITSAIAFIINVVRSTALPENERRVDVRSFWLPTGILAASGAGPLIVALAYGDRSPGTGPALFVTLLFGASLVVFGKVEHRAWRRAIAQER